MRSWSLLCANELVYLRNDFDGFSIRQELGTDGDHLLPRVCTPTTAIELSWVAPNCTSRSLAVHLPARSCATINRKPAGLRGIWNDGAEWHRGSGWFGECH